MTKLDQDNVNQVTCFRSGKHNSLLHFVILHYLTARIKKNCNLYVFFVWCIRAVPLSVFSGGDNFCTSKGMKITCTAYSRANKIIQLYHVFVQRMLGPYLVFYPLI